MEIQCTFKYSDKLYGCYIENHQIPSDRDLILVGEHGHEETNNDVTLLQIINCTMTSFSKEFVKLYPNLKSLEIKNSKLMTLCKADLADFKKLEKIDCLENQLEVLPGELFEGLKNLEWVGFYGNKLKIVEPNIFDGLEKLKHAEFRSNTNYNNYTDNTSLINLKNYLVTQFFSLEPLAIKAYFSKFKPSIQQVKIYVNLCGTDDTKNKIWEQHHAYLHETYAHNIQVMKKVETNLRRKVEYFERFGEHLLHDLKAFIQDETTKDFKIIIDNHEFPVHKFLLAARSPTLAELLKNNPEVENLNLADISVETFEIILKFLYTDELPGDDGTNFLLLFAAAGKLMIKKLQTFASMNLRTNFKDENAIEIFKLSDKYEDNDLRLKAFEEIQKIYNKVNLKDEWIDDPEKVSKIIDMYKKKEEAMRKIEEEFEQSVIKECEDYAQAFSNFQPRLTFENKQEPKIKKEIEIKKKPESNTESKITTETGSENETF